jgi:hemoglobin-like flavoprotein
MRTPFLDIDFDPEQYPVYSPEEAGGMGIDLSNKGINPTFTNMPIQNANVDYADSGQIGVDMRPPYGEPSNEDMQFVEEMTKFMPYLENAAGKIYGFSYVKDEDKPKKDAFIKMGMDKFKANFFNKGNLSLQGLDPDTKEEVYLDPQRGLVKRDRTPYITTKPLLPKTENTFNMNQPTEQEFQSDKQMIMSGQLLISDVIRNGGRGGQGQAYARKLREAIHSENPNFNFQLAEMVRKGDQTELNQTQGMRGKILAFEKTAIQNAKQVYNLIDQINPSQIPLINKALLAGKTQITGDPKASAFMTAWRTFVNEYARVSTTATGAGVTSDTARKEMEDVIKSSSNAEQLKANVKQAVLEMSHRRYGFDSQLEEIYNRYGKRSDFKAELPTEEYINSIFASPTPNVNKSISRSEYFSVLKKANPKESDAKINAYLDKKGIK